MADEAEMLVVATAASRVRKRVRLPMAQITAVTRMKSHSSGGHCFRRQPRACHVKLQHLERSRKRRGPVKSMDPSLAATRRARHREEASRMQSTEDTAMPDDIVAAEEDYDQPEELYNEAGIPIEPFHLRAEREEGYFDAEGNYMEYRIDANLTDAWLDSLKEAHGSQVGVRVFLPATLGFGCEGADRTAAAPPGSVRRTRPAAWRPARRAAPQGQGGLYGSGLGGDADADDLAEMDEEDMAVYQMRIADMLLPAETVLQGLKRLGDKLHEERQAANGGGASGLLPAARRPRRRRPPPARGRPRGAGGSDPVHLWTLSSGERQRLRRLRQQQQQQQQPAQAQGGVRAARQADGSSRSAGTGTAGTAPPAADVVMADASSPAGEGQTPAEPAAAAAGAVSGSPRPRPSPRRSGGAAGAGVTAGAAGSSGSEAAVAAPTGPAGDDAAAGDAGPAPGDEAEVGAEGQRAVRRPVHRDAPVHGGPATQTSGSCAPAPPVARAPPAPSMAFEQLTSYADLLLSAGNFNIYSTTREQLLQSARAVLGPQVVSDAVRASSEAGALLAAVAVPQRASNPYDDGDADDIFADGDNSTLPPPGPVASAAAPLAGGASSQGHGDGAAADAMMTTADAGADDVAGDDRPAAHAGAAAAAAAGTSCGASSGRMTPPLPPQDAAGSEGDAAALQQVLQGFVLDESSGYMYNSSLGYYYDPATSLFGDASTGTWYRYHDGQYEAVVRDRGGGGDEMMSAAGTGTGTNTSTAEATAA